MFAAYMLYRHQLASKTKEHVATASTVHVEA